jgi:hypothetical protein
VFDSVAPLRICLSSSRIVSCRGGEYTSVPAQPLLPSERLDSKLKHSQASPLYSSRYFLPLETPNTNSKLNPPHSLHRPPPHHQLRQCIHNILGPLSLRRLRRPTTPSPGLDKYCYCRCPLLPSLYCPLRPPSEAISLSCADFLVNEDFDILLSPYPAQDQYPEGDFCFHKRLLHC